MVSESDNTASDMLLRLVGEPKLVTEYLRSLGVSDMVVANTEKELAQNPPPCSIVTMRHLTPPLCYCVPFISS